MHLIFGILLFAGMLCLGWAFWSDIAYEIVGPGSSGLFPCAVVLGTMAFFELLIPWFNAWSVWPAGEWVSLFGCALFSLGLALDRWAMPDLVWARFVVLFGIIIAIVGVAGTFVAYAAEHVYWD